MRLPLALTTLAAAALVVSGCSQDDPKPPVESPERSVKITKIVDRTRSDYYTVDTSVPASARVRTLYGGTFPDLTFYLQVSNVNQIVVEPVGTVTYADGSTITCEETDLRRHPSLIRPFLEVTLPCPATLRTDEPGALTVTDRRPS